MHQGNIINFMIVIRFSIRKHSNSYSGVSPAVCGAWGLRGPQLADGRRDGTSRFSVAYLTIATLFSQGENLKWFTM